MLREDSLGPRGQVLVIVALGVVALVAIVALAVDGGHVYAERRKMQNAADAAALAGARVLCYEDGTNSQVTTEANRYAIDLNGAHGAVVTISRPLTVTVVTTETTDTFFANVIGFSEVEVSARASAMCQGPEAAGGIWPLAVHQSVWANDDDVGCGELFFAFVDREDINMDLCDLTQTRLANSNSTSWPTCYVGGLPVALPDVDEVGHVSTSQRGWIDLFKPNPPYDTICPGVKCNPGGGANDVACWIREGHPGPIEIGDCLQTEHGLEDTVLQSVNDNDSDGVPVPCSIRNLPLFNLPCAQGETLKACPVDVVGPSTTGAYKVSGFGCIRVIGYFKVDFRCSGSWDRNHKVVIVQKVCEDDPAYSGSCMSAGYAGSGGQPSDTDTIIIQLTE